jgi:hypothetical protein
MASEARLLMIQFLDWVDCRPCRYGEIRAAWSSTCPLNCAWEDAISDDLVHYEGDGRLVLTERGRARLAEAGAPGLLPGGPLPGLLAREGGVS